MDRADRAKNGAVDLLVNNAGGVAEQQMRPIEEVPDADWDRIFAVKRRCCPHVEPSSGGRYEAGTVNLAKLAALARTDRRE